MTERPVTVAQAAEYLHCSVDTVYDLVAARTIPARKIGGKWLFFLSESRKARPPAGPGDRPVSLYRDPKSPNWYIDVERGGQRVRRSSGTGTAESTAEWQLTAVPETTKAPEAEAPGG